MSCTLMVPILQQLCQTLYELYYMCINRLSSALSRKNLVLCNSVIVINTTTLNIYHLVNENRFPRGTHEYNLTVSDVVNVSLFAK